MKKKTVARKGVAVVLTAALLAPTSAFAAVPSDFSDFPNDWSTQAMTEAVENGLLGGVSDGVIAPSGLLTRAQMAAIINRAFGATETASLSGYTDVAQSDWYYTDMAMAVQMGTFVGEGGGRLNPNSAITREEAFCVLARAFSIDTASASTLSQFSDNSAVSSWAREAVAGMIANGCVSGYEDGTLRPQGTITRAEFASVMSRLVDQYISEAGNVTTDEDGNVLVRAAGVTLSDMTIDGDLILADGIGTGDVTLDGVTVEGRLLIRGGGSDSIHITDSTIKGGIILNNPNTATRIVPQNSDLGEINVQSDLVVDGDVDTITVSSAADVTVDGGTVSKIVVSAAADDATITVNDGATVDTIEANADGVSVSGDGEVTSVTANANDITVTTTDTEVTAAEGTSGVTAGGVEVPAGETVVSGEGTTTEEPDTDRPGGTTGGGTIRPPAVEEEQAIEVDSWAELKQAIQKVENGGTIRLTADIKDAGADTTVVDGVSSATLPMESEEGKYFTLDGDGHSITAAADRTFCFLISSVGGETVVKDLTIDGASFSSKMGGAFFVEGGDALFQNVTFKDCVAGSASATNGGGAILVNNHGSNAYPNVTIENCTFEDNKVGDGTTGRGGAVYANNLNTTPGSEGKERIKVTIKDSAFSGNQAAYGTAIAADGNVDLTVEGCTFTDQAGDDIYIYEGTSQGKKNMTIYSNVNATLSDNTDATAIYSRFYPAGYPSAPGTAPEVAQDKLFSDIERTQEADFSTSESIAMQETAINGHTYYYGVAEYGADGWITDFTVDGSAVKATQIGGSNVYYYTDDALEGTLYGTDSLNYAELYSKEADGAADIDAVSSATTGKNNIFTNADSTDPVEGEGYQINGVKNMGVAVDAAQYAEAEVLEAAGALTAVKDNGYTNAASITLSENATTAPAVYKPLNSDGSYGELQAETKATVNSANLEIETSSRWGDYLLKVIETDTKYLRNNRDTDWPVGENILGAIVTATKDDQTMNVGMKHLQNIWVQPYEIAFTLADSDQFAALEGATVTQITYIVPEGIYVYNFDENNFIKPQYKDAALSASFNDEKTQVTITGLPDELEDVTVNIYQNKGHGQKTMIATDKTPVDGVVTLNEGAQVDETVTYTVQITSSNYADLQTTVTAAEPVEPGEGEQELNGEATVQTFGYTAKVTVVYDPATGKITAVRDNGTEAGSNSSYWQKATGIFASLAGKGADEIDGVDAVTSATLSSNAIKEAVKNALAGAEEPGEDAALSDGTWYGTGEWSRYYSTKGPDVVKLTIEDGKITSAESVRYSEDSGYEDGKKILGYMNGLDDLDALTKQLSDRTGDAYDAVSGATETARGYISAAENALDRSQKYTTDGEEQTIAWLEVSQTAKTPMYFGEALDLSPLTLDVYTLPDGEKKTVTYDQLDDYGIQCSWKNGTTINQDTEGVNMTSETTGLVPIELTNENSLIKFPTSVTASKKINYQYADKIVVTYEDKEPVTIKLNEDDFSYTLESVGKITGMAIYAGDEKLADGVYEKEYGEYSFDLSEVTPGEGYDSWKFETYYVAVDSSADTSAIASFTIDESYLTKSYTVGQTLDLSGIAFDCETEKGSAVWVSSWEEAKERGFSASPDNGYTFTAEDAEAGEKTITISCGSAEEQTFTVKVANVADYDAMIPAEVVLKDAETDESLATIEVDQEKWAEDAQWGGVTLYDKVTIPTKYEDWDESTFKLEIKNAAGDTIDDTLYTLTKEYDFVHINFPEYKEYSSDGAYLQFMLSFEDSEPAKTTEATGSATVGSFGYEARVKVTYNTADGTIVSVADNGTEATGANSGFWQNATAMFEKFVGLDRTGVEALKTDPAGEKVDAVSNATYSSDAIKEAVLEALPS